MGIKIFHYFTKCIPCHFGGEICIRIKQDITFKMPQNPYFLRGGGGRTPYQGVALDPIFWLDGPLAHQFHFPDISLLFTEAEKPHFDNS